MKQSVLVLIPMRPTLAPSLMRRSYELAARMQEANPDLDLAIVFDSRQEESLPTDARNWSKVARVRNKMLRSLDWPAFGYVLWIDADVIDYPADLPTRFIRRNPGQVQAPMVLVEDSTRFYDTCAFIIQGRSHIEPEHLSEIPGRNLRHSGPPYWPAVPDEIVVPMDCVGTIVLVPTSVYASMYEAIDEEIYHTDHPAFTDHFSVCEAARRMGTQVLVDRQCVAYHADLPKYGESWH